MEIEAGGKTDVGRVRDSNEDALLIDVALGLFAVADGMGGHSAGEVASNLALETLRTHVANASADVPLATCIADAIVAASHAVAAEAARDRSKHAMGTTLTALLIRDGQAVLGHVGDSRLYRVRWGDVAKLTDDHTAVAEMVRLGGMNEEDAKDHPWANVLSRVVGKGDVEVQTAAIDLQPGDRFLLCSDGFSDSLTDPQWITSIVQKSPGESAAELVSRAVGLDGNDNATAVVVAIGGDDDREKRKTLWGRLRDAVGKSLSSDD